MVFKLDGKAKASTGDPVAGGVLFGRYCTTCHSPTRVNPDLHRSEVPLSKDLFKAGATPTVAAGRPAFSR